VCHGHAGIGLNNVARNSRFVSTPIRAVGPVGLKHVSTSLVNPDSAKVDSILSPTTREPFQFPWGARASHLHADEPQDPLVDE
jgi:hypothetical protein